MYFLLFISFVLVVMIKKIVYTTDYKLGISIRY